MAQAPWDNFPIPADLVNDVDLEWPVAGQLKRLTSESEFSAAFNDLDIQKTWKPVTRASFNGLAPWKQKQIIQALNAPPPYSYRFPHGEVQAASDLEHIEWSSCVGVQRSDSGTEGVIFVELPEKKAVVVKAPLYVAAEMFGNLLCGRLGVKCPKARVVKSDSAEASVLVNALIAADVWRHEEERRIHSMLVGRPLLLVIEYVEATELADIFQPATDGRHQKHSVSCCDTWSAAAFGLQSGQPGALSEHGKTVLRALGTFIAFDMIINNFDRLPCIWQNAGNPGNIMFTKTSAEPISIDNMVCCIPAENAEAISKYMEAVKWLIIDVAQGPGVECMELSRVRSFLKNGCVEGHGWTGLQIDIGVEGTLEIQTGFLNLVYFAAYGDSGEDEGGITLTWLEEVRDALFQQLPAGDLSKAPKHMYGFCTIHPEFCHKVIETFRAALSEIGKAPKVDRPPPPSRSLSFKGLDNKTLKTRGDRVEAVLHDGNAQMPMFLTAQGRQTYLETLARRQKQLKNEGVLRMRAARAREAAAKRALEPTPEGFYRMEALARVGPWPEGVEPHRREAWLSPEDFQKVFGMDKAAFYALPLWTQKFRKQKVNLF